MHVRARTARLAPAAALLAVVAAACGGHSAPASMTLGQRAQLQLQARSLFEEAHGVKPGTRVGCGVSPIGSASFRGALTYVAWVDCVAWSGSACGSVESAAAHNVTAYAATYRDGALFTARYARAAYQSVDVPDVFPQRFRAVVIGGPSAAQGRDMEAAARAQAGCA